MHTQAYYAEWIPHFCKKCQIVGHVCDDTKSRRAYTVLNKMSQDVVKAPIRASVESNGAVKATVQASVKSNGAIIQSKSAVQPCDVEEGEWVQVTGKKNKGKEVLVPAEDNGGVVTAEGAGIPLSPISHP